MSKNQPNHVEFLIGRHSYETEEMQKFVILLFQRNLAKCAIQFRNIRIDQLISTSLFHELLSTLFVTETCSPSP